MSSYAAKPATGYNSQGLCSCGYSQRDEDQDNPFPLQYLTEKIMNFRRISVEAAPCISVGNQARH